MALSFLCYVYHNCVRSFLIFQGTETMATKHKISKKHVLLKTNQMILANCPVVVSKEYKELRHYGVRYNQPQLQCTIK